MILSADPITNVRLVMSGNTNASEGRLEVLRGDQWGTVRGQLNGAACSRATPGPSASVCHTWHALELGLMG